MSDLEPTIKRCRVQRSASPQRRIEGDDDYEPYVPVAQRRQAKLAKLSAWGSSTTRDSAREERRVEEDREDEEQEEERRREKVRRGRALLVEAQEVHSKKASEGVWFLHCALNRDIETQFDRCQKNRGREGRRGRCTDSSCNSQQKEARVRQRTG